MVMHSETFFNSRINLVFYIQTIIHVTTKAVLSVRKHLTKQLPDGRFGSKVPILLYFVEPKSPSDNC